jgi:hypothetical protein
MNGRKEGRREGANDSGEAQSSSTYVRPDNDHFSKPTARHSPHHVPISSSTWKVKRGPGWWAPGMRTHTDGAVELDSDSGLARITSPRHKEGTPYSEGWQPNSKTT